MNDAELFLSNGGLIYHGLPPAICRDNGKSHAVKQWDAGRFDRREAEVKYKQRRKEGNPYGNYES